MDFLSPPGRPTIHSLYFPTARIVRGPMLPVLDVAATVRGDVSLMDRAFATSERFWLLDEF